MATLKSNTPIITDISGKKKDSKVVDNKPVVKEVKKVDNSRKNFKSKRGS